MKPKGRKSVFDVDFFENLTGELSAPSNREIEAIGDRIRAIREEKGASLEDLSKLTGFEVDFLAGIEKGEVQPQLGTMIKLSKALHSAFGRLVSGTGEKLYSITRKSERRAAARSTSKTGKKHLYSYKSLAPDVKGRHMEALMVQLLTATEKDVSVH
ncbi:MAG TPA: helix-turn-helix transcriptional regulator, partial [Desulfobacterales bacterium]|nr:helix-turn-helix transcriptional regulator [Desulfobacterales bacterium]